MTHRLLTLCVFALGLASLGCNAGRALIATPNDYADYRRVRIAETFDDRMANTWHYLKERPEGRYAGRLRKFFDRVEPVFYKVRSRNVAGLQAYLLALPDGPHAGEALELLTELKRDQRREQLDTRLAQQTGRRLDAEKKARAAATELPMWWTHQLMNEAMWDTPLAEAPPEFLVRFRLALPRPECQQDDPEPGSRRCTKTVTVGYRVRGERGRVDRSVSLDVELVLDAEWRLQRAILSGADLFTRSEEAGRGEQLDVGSPEVARAASVRFVAQLTKALFGDEMVCNGGTDDSGVTLLTCEILRVSVEPSSGGDLILIERTSNVTQGDDDDGDDDDDDGDEGDDDDDDDGDEGDDDDDNGDDDDDDDDQEESEPESPTPTPSPSPE